MRQIKSAIYNFISEYSHERCGDADTDRFEAATSLQDQLNVTQVTKSDGS